MMGELGVTHVVLHLDPLVRAFGQAAVDAIDSVPWLTREYADDEARVYRVGRGCAGESALGAALSGRRRLGGRLGLAGGASGMTTGATDADGSGASTPPPYRRR